MATMRLRRGMLVRSSGDGMVAAQLSSKAALSPGFRPSCSSKGELLPDPNNCESRGTETTERVVGCYEEPGPSMHAPLTLRRRDSTLRRGEARRRWRCFFRCPRPRQGEPGISNLYNQESRKGESKPLRGRGAVKEPTRVRVSQQQPGSPSWSGLRRFQKRPGQGRKRRDGGVDQPRPNTLGSRVPSGSRPHRRQACKCCHPRGRSQGA